MTVVAPVCVYCGRSGEPGGLRPYGPGGALVCFKCATSSKHDAETKAEYARQLGAAGPVAVLTPDGPKPWRAN
mgnify:FL=1